MLICERMEIGRAVERGGQRGENSPKTSKSGGSITPNASRPRGVHKVRPAVFFRSYFPGPQIFRLVR